VRSQRRHHTDTPQWTKVEAGTTGTWQCQCAEWDTHTVLWFCGCVLSYKRKKRRAVDLGHHTRGHTRHALGGYATHQHKVTPRHANSAKKGAHTMLHATPLARQRTHQVSARAPRDKYTPGGEAVLWLQTATVPSGLSTE